MDRPDLSASAPERTAVRAHALGRAFRSPRAQDRRRAPTEDRRWALRGVELSIPSGAFVAILGANGSGKSTLLRILAGADAPTEGRAEIFGADPAHDRRARASVGLVFQRPALDPLLTVRENARVHGRLFAMGRASIENRVRELAERLGLNDRLDERVKTLSGGLMRRADLLRALLPAPRLLLLDEPTAALDPEARADVLALLRGLRHAPPEAPSEPLTVVLSTHTLEEAEDADRVLLLEGGRVRLDAGPRAWRRMSGVTVLRIDAHEADAARRALAGHDGMNQALIPGPGHELLARAHDEQERAGLARAASALAASGVAFSLGPPTLAEVYADAREAAP